MKKNSEYIGADEKYIPEDEKYTNGPIVEEDEKTKKAIKAFGIGYLVFIGIGLLVGVLLIFFSINYFLNTKKEMSESLKEFDNQFGNVSEIIDNSKDQFSNVSDIIDNSKEQLNNIIKDKENLENVKEQIQNKISESEIKFFNSSYESRAGTEYGTNVVDLLEDIVTNNKTNKEHIINVSYNGKTASDEQGIVEIKYTFEKWTEYEVSLDYDEQGLVNKITITDIKR